MFQAYLITCLVNGKQYIGVTARSIKRRWYEHATDSKSRPGQSALRRAIAKHGESNFTVQSVFCAFTYEDLLVVEKELIQQFGTRSPRGYNLTLGGQGANGCKRSPEHIAAIVRAQTGSHRSAEARAKISAARLGKSFNVGSNNPGAKLTAQQVAAARTRIAAGETQRSIAREFGVSFTAIWKIANGLKWASVA